MLYPCAINAMQNHLITPLGRINHKHFGMLLDADSTCLHSIDKSHIAPRETHWMTWRHCNYGPLVFLSHNLDTLFYPYRIPPMPNSSPTFSPIALLHLNHTNIISSPSIEYIFLETFYFYFCHYT